MKEYHALTLYDEPLIKITDGSKTEEYRSWPTNIRGDVILCATATKTHKGFACLMVEIYGCEHRGDHYAFLLRNVRAIKPVAVAGKQRFFKIEIEPNVIERGNLSQEEWFGLIDDAFIEAEPLLLKEKKRKEKNDDTGNIAKKKCETGDVTVGPGREGGENRDGR